MDELKQLSLFDELALEYNLSLVENKENVIFDEDLFETLLIQIEKDIKKFMGENPAYNAFTQSPMGLIEDFKTNTHLFSKGITYRISHANMLYNPQNNLIKTDENFGIHFSLMDGKNYKNIIDKLFIPYDKEKLQEKVTKEELKQEILLNDEALKSKLKEIRTKLQNYFGIKSENNALISKLKNHLLEFDENFPIYNAFTGFVVGINHIEHKLDENFKLEISHENFHFNPRKETIKTDENFGIKFKLKDNINDFDKEFKIPYELCKNQGKELTRNDLKDIKIDKEILITQLGRVKDYLNTFKLKEVELKSNNLKGDNDEHKQSQGTNQRETKEELQQSSHIQPLSMGFTKPLKPTSTQKSVLDEVRKAEFANGLKQDETRGDERGYEKTSPNRSKAYRMANETRDRNREGAYQQICETLARNSLDANEKLAKNSQQLLKNVELTKEFEEALLQLYLTTKSQKELEHFHKMKNIYANFSQKFRERDSFSKIEEKYQKQNNILTPKQKEKMLDDYMLALSTGAQVELSEDTIKAINLTLQGKIGDLQNENAHILKHEEGLKELKKELNNEVPHLKAMQDKKAIKKII
ncbi:hypothetical protein CUPS3808_04080 [Campylobacter upsaliensis]|uniref:hypothetical protein n=1 Tax=Campylobacter upsaliensis TaxID=28080 RepID=UPI00214A4D1D|nr:hypothetical protein [Campylobacter upsaliensis]MCR2117052.1 hypothetical protein [Campylobacter upsaliensis]